MNVTKATPGSDPRCCDPLFHCREEITFKSYPRYAVRQLYRRLVEGEIKSRNKLTDLDHRADYVGGNLGVILGAIEPPGLTFNGRSLTWMGLTRERWCCTRG